MRLHNFSAGPAALPTSVLEEARDEFLEYKDAGASIMEVSHRSPQYTAVAESARALLRELLGLGEEWHILFLQGGASLQFHQAPLNFLPRDGVADYVDTGVWAGKAIKEAQQVGAVNVAASSKADGYTHIPARSDWNLTDNAAFVHFTSNNTIHGTAFSSDPEVDAPLVCDASSDFLSRPLEMSKYGLLYAGAQKNLGPAGVTIVLLHDDFMKGRRQGLPTILDYGTHAAKLFHTPPAFAVYLVEKVLRWIRSNGSLPGMLARNQGKASHLYKRLDRTEFYRPTAAKDNRSMMNVTFRLPSEELEASFVANAKKEGLLALKGYRTVGGIRASIYNALEPASVRKLVSFMDDFESKNG